MTTKDLDRQFLTSSVHDTTANQLHDFLASRSFCRPATRKLYASFVRNVGRWMGDRAISVDTCTAYLQHLRDRGVANATLLNAYRHLKTLCRWLHEQDRIARNPFVGKGRVPVVRTETTWQRTLPESAVIHLLATTYERPDWKLDRCTTRTQWRPDGPLAREALQGRALVVLLVDSAMRAGEICKLSCGDVRQWHVVVDGKGGHKGPGLMTPLTRETLVELAGARDDGDPLFRNWNGGRCTVGTLRSMLWRLARRANVRLPPRPVHSFRHYAAREWLRNKVGDQAIQQMMRHKDISTTQLYTKLPPDQLAELHAEASPIARLVAAARRERLPDGSPRGTMPPT